MVVVDNISAILVPFSNFVSFDLFCFVLLCFLIYFQPREMAHLAWAAASSIVIPSPSPALDDPSTMATPGARRHSISSSWSVCSTLVEQPADAPTDFTRPAPVTSDSRQRPTSLLVAEWGPMPWSPTDSNNYDTRGASDVEPGKKRRKMVQAWQKVKTRLSIGARPSYAEDQMQQPVSPNSAARGNRRTLDFRIPRSPSSAASPNSYARHSWHSSSSSSSRTANPPSSPVEMVWGSMAAGFII